MRLYSYAQRMQILVLKSLERCQMIIDLKTTFKILNGEFYLGQDNSFIKLRPNTHYKGIKNKLCGKQPIVLANLIFLFLELEGFGIHFQSMLMPQNPFPVSQVW